MVVRFDDPKYGSRIIKGMEIEYDSPFPESNREALSPRYFIAEITGTRTRVDGPFVTVATEDGFIIRPVPITLKSG